MEDNATDEVNHHEIERRDNAQQTRYITWPGQEVDENQRSILQPVSGNGGRKMKGEAETRHGAKKSSTSLAALNLIARKRVDKKIAFKRMENRSPKQPSRRDQPDS